MTAISNKWKRALQWRCTLIVVLIFVIYWISLRHTQHIDGSSHCDVEQCRDILVSTQSPSFRWFDDEHAFESELGIPLKSFKLDDALFLDTKMLDEITNRHSTSHPLSSTPSILYVVGPPAAGKSSISTQYAPSLGIDIASAVITDGDLVRKSHLGIRQYLEMTNKLKIGYSPYFKLVLCSLNEMEIRTLCVFP